MRTMYDSVTAADIPTTATMVAGYVDGVPRWSPADWARFPGAIKVRIALDPATDDGHVLDIERGAANPDQAPGWVRRRRAAGVTPTVYCSLALWPAVRQQFAVQYVDEPLYWIAAYPGGGPLNVPDGAVAHQFAGENTGSGGHYDLSAVRDYWPGVDAGPSNEGELDMSAAFWFIGNTATGEAALLYPNGDFVGVDGANYTAVISNNHVPKLDVGQDVWNDMAGRLSKRLAEAAQLAADAFKADGVGGAGPAVDEPVEVTMDGTMHVGKLPEPAEAPQGSGSTVGGGAESAADA